MFDVMWRLMTAVRSMENSKLLGAGLYIVTAGTDGKVVVWADEGKACVATRECATPVVDAVWHPSANVLALQVATACGCGRFCTSIAPNMATDDPETSRASAANLWLIDI
jgi:hypothetical protein